MLFNSHSFAVFLPLVFGLYWLIGGNPCFLGGVIDSTLPKPDHNGRAGSMTPRTGKRFCDGGGHEGGVTA
jgi:hypothetical protein